MDPLAHASIALMAKPTAPKAPLLALVAATQVPDLLSFGLMAVGVERGAETRLDFQHGLQYLSQPSIVWSHGLLMCLVASALVAGIAYLVWRDRRTSAIMGLMVLSHWLLDAIVYPNMPLLLGDLPVVGLGLITTGPGLVVGILMEIGLIAGGMAAYISLRRRRRTLVPG